MRQSMFYNYMDVMDVNYGFSDEEHEDLDTSKKSLKKAWNL